MHTATVGRLPNEQWEGLSHSDWDPHIRSTPGDRYSALSSRERAQALGERTDSVTSSDKTNGPQKAHPLHF